MQLDPRANASARLNKAHSHMRSALAVLDLVEGTGYAAAYLDHAIALVQERLVEFGVETSECAVAAAPFEESSTPHVKPN